jgi:glycerate kinase
VGFALLAVLGARTRPGAELVFDLIGFHDALAGADLVITGEGSLDDQTLSGKAPAAVAAAARAQGVPVVAVAGQVRLGAGALEAAGFDAAYALVDEAATREQAFDAPGPLLERLGARIARHHLGGPLPEGARGALASGHPVDGRVERAS